MSETRKIKVWIDTGFNSASHTDFLDLPDGWDVMTPAEQEERLEEEAREFLGNKIDYGAAVVENDDE